MLAHLGPRARTTYSQGLSELGARDNPLVYPAVDDTISRAYHYSPQKERDRESVRESGGVLTTKIDAAVDALGKHVSLLPAGRASYFALIEAFEAGCVLADTG